MVFRLLKAYRVNKQNKRAKGRAFFSIKGPRNLISKKKTWYLLKKKNLVLIKKKKILIKKKKLLINK
jgi:hypothetical protein